MYRIIFSVGVISLSSLSFGQGLDNLTPGSDSKAVQEAEKKANELKEKAEGAEKAVEEMKPEVSASKVVPKTGLGKNLENKLRIGTAASIAMSMSAPSGEYTPGGVGEVFFLYDIGKDVSGFKLYASGRFAPLDFTAVIDDQAYRGVVDNYQGGVTGERMFSGVTVMATAELGYQINWLDSLDGKEMPDGTDESGVGVNLAGSVVWKGFDGKLIYGPKLGYTAGSYGFAQLGGELSFVF